jgi:hypothetical protein
LDIQPLQDLSEAAILARRKAQWRKLAFFLCAFFVFTAVVMLKHVYNRRASMVGDGTNPASYGFDLSNLTVPIKNLVGSHSPRDSQTVLDDPVIVTPEQVLAGGLKEMGPKIVNLAALDSVNELTTQKVLSGGTKRLIAGPDAVIALTVNGESRAYPVRVMRWHEICNDTLGGIPIAVTYNPICDSAVVFDRRVDGKAEKFGFSGLLYNSNLVMYDRQPEGKPQSLWSQLKFESIAGPRAGTKLTVLPMSFVTWADWRKAHPETTVMIGQQEQRNEYPRDPYADMHYFEKAELWFPVDPLPPKDSPLKLMDEVMAEKNEDGIRIVTPIAMYNSEKDGGNFTLGNGHVGFGSEPFIGRYSGLAPYAHSRWFAWYAFHGDEGLQLPETPSEPATTEPKK